MIAVWMTSVRRFIREICLEETKCQAGEEAHMVSDSNTFCRKIDKSQIPTCNIMGVNIAAINMDWLLDFTDKNIKRIDLLVTICAFLMYIPLVQLLVMRITVLSRDGGIMAIPDGGPLSSVGRKRGCMNMERTTGPSYTGEILKLSAEKGYRHYFYGSTEETLEKLYKSLTESYPGIRIAGMCGPPFRPTTPKKMLQW